MGGEVSMNTFRILIADDHPVFRLGLCSMLTSHHGWEVCGHAVDGRDAVEKCRQLQPDLLILDICMPKLNGVDAARQVLKNNPAQQILVLTDVNSENIVRECLEIGVRGWIFKSDELDELVKAVESLQQHKSAFSSSVSNQILDGYLQKHHARTTGATMQKLTPREREVLQLLSEGKTTKEVATVLNLAVKTAETHRSNIMFKLNLHSLAQLVLYAVRNGIIHVQLAPVLPFRTALGKTSQLREVN
jgi:DNA-binding NarL/FixJ family response regulator